MASLTLKHVSKVYEQKGHAATRAVIDVNMDIDDGEIIGLLGSSGCGKTSTLRMIAGFESITEGDIKIGSRIINHLKASERNVAMAFEGYALYPPLKVADNIAFSLLRNKTPKAKADEKVKMIAELLEITDILDHYPPLLSSGQQQRVSLARALVRPADVHLLDEPMSQLEPQLRAVLRARIKDYLIEHEMTSVFVTHDQTEAMALADRIAVMSEGVLQQFGSPADLKERPSNLFVASFIGEPPMNILKAHIAVEGRLCKVVVHDGDDKAAFAVDLGEIGGPIELRDGQAVQLGIRPHKLQVGERNGAARPVNRIKGTLLSNQWLGDQSHVGISVAGCLLLAVTDRDVQLTTDSEITVGLPVEALHLFDAKDGQALLHGAELTAPPHS
jgi:multiple sugar transport system ATP-binding protein